MKNLHVLMICLFMATVAAAQPERVVLIEEGTGTWCQYCPRGDVYAKELHSNFPNQYVMVAVHDNDPMELASYIEALQLDGLPSGLVDRSFVSNLDPFFDAPQDMESRLSITPPANIAVSSTWNESTREIVMTISATMFEDLSGNFRLGAIVLEDAVTGPAPAYDQSNSYSGGDLGPMGGYEDLPSPVSASIMVYNHVAREIPGGFEGAPNSMPDNLVNGEIYSYEYSYILPESYDENYIHIAGFMVDTDSGNILNAGGGSYILGYDNAPPFFHSNPTTAAYIDLEYQYDILAQDPNYDDLTITALTSLPNGLELNTTGNGTSVLSGIPTEEGVFDVTLNVNDGTYDVEQSFQIEISTTSVDWLLVGAQGFSEEDLYNSDIRIKPNGTPVVMTVTGNDQMQLFEIVGNEWVELGENLPVNAFHASFCLDNEGTPIAFDANGRVYKLEGAQWEQVGGNLPHSNNIYSTITVDGNDQIHVVYFNPPAETIGFYYDGSEWVSTGDISDGIGVWCKLKTSPEGTPLVMYGTDGTSILYSELAEWDGSAWNLLGGGYIEPSSQTSFDHDFTVTSSGEIYAALTIGANLATNVYRITDDAWEMVTENVSGGATENCQIGVDNQDNIIVLYRDENEGARTSSKVLIGDTWEYLGLPGFTNPAGGQTMAIDPNGIPYVAFEDETLLGAISCRRYADITFSIFEQKKDSQLINLFPNPNNGEFTLQFEQGDLVEVYDISGRKIFQQNIPQHQNQLVLNLDAPAGVYLVRILDSDSYATARLVIE